MMKGLIRKDFLGLSSYGKILGMIVLLYGGISLFAGNATSLSSMLMVLCAMLPVTVSAVDEQSKWYSYVQCMPIPRRTIVLERYILLVLFAFIAAVLAVGLAALTSFRAPVDWGEYFTINVLLFCMIFLFNTFSMPAIFRYGAEKARLLLILIFVLFMIPFLLIMNNETATNFLFSIPIFVFPLVTLVLFVASYFVSVSIYEKKEL